MDIGIDEVGRGALAGPLVVCVVSIIAPRLFPYADVRDSKLLKSEAREALVQTFQKTCQWHFGVVSNRLIDRIGIQGANVLAVDLALRDFPRDGQYLSDAIGGFKNYTIHARNISFYARGESRYSEIAAASILAKVYRDDLMRDLVSQYPSYGFERHVGYGTREHYEAIRRYGLTPVHRRSFIHL